MRILLRLLITIVFISFVGSYNATSSGGKNIYRYIAQLENIAYDYRVALTMPGTVDERIESYIIESPPETWDGVFIHATK